MPYTGEVESSAIGTPYKLIHVAVEGTAHETLLACGKVHHVEAVPVALIAVALHALPSDHGAVGRVLWIGVIAHVLVRSIRLADVLCLTSLNVIEVDVAIGALGVGGTRLLAAGVGDGLAIGAPCQLLYATEGAHGRLVELALEDVARVGHHVAVKVGQEGVGDLVDPLVPMLIHEVIDDTTRGEGQVGVLVYRRGTILHGHHEEHLCLVG